MSSLATIFVMGRELPPDAALAKSALAEGFLVSSIPGGTRDAAEAIAADSSEWLAFVESEGSFSAGAGAALGAFAEQNPESAVVYTDEAVRHGRREIVVNKPDASPERLRCQFYWGDVVFYRRELLERIGGPDPLLPGAELYDLALRASRSGAEVAHLAEPLFMREHDPVVHLDESARVSTRVALEAHLSATGGGEVREVGSDGVHDTRRLVRGEPLISIVIPSRGVYTEIDGARRCYLVDAVRSIEDLSTYRNFELTIVLDSVADPEVIADLRRLAGDRLNIVDWAKPFNFSEKVNEGVLRSHGEYVLLLNDDVTVITPGWLESLLSLAQLPGAGMSGAMLYYDDDTIQHAGHGYFEGDASHIGLDDARSSPGPLNGYRVEREVAGVTAACAMMSKAVFLEVGGLSNLLPGNFNDVDLCMKVTWLGHEIYWTPHAELYHYESKTRDASVHAFEVRIAWGRWGFRMHSPKYWPYPHSRPPL